MEAFWPNITIVICGGIILATLGFIVYGCVKGFDKVFPDE